MSQMKKSSYEDMLGLPHHVSKTHPQMSRMERAAQFSPFAALTDFGKAIEEASRITGDEIEKNDTFIGEERNV